ncbi:MAG: VWA domain-containing protein [Microcoleus sp. CAN_BIN18]|nr:VWA domain-containing protein [Microcoleus sp. CAN_BIN18]
MFNLELAWDRPAKISSQKTTHVLRVRIRPQTGRTGLPSLPLRLAIALDNSQSMEGEKLQRAKEACRVVVGQLRDTDRLSIAAFSSRVTPLLESLAGGSAGVAAANAAISGLQTDSVTRTDLALDWLQNAFPRENGVARVGILITDGHATNSRGTVLEDVTALIDQSAQLSQSGFVLCTVGLGKAANFNTAFLTDLSDKGKGAFIYADALSNLEPLLQERLAACQAIATESAKLRLIPATDVIPTGFCRFRPEYLPLEETVKNELSLGAIRTDSPTDVLIELDTPPSGFGEPAGSRNVISLELTASGLTSPITATGAINYTNSYTEVQKINTELDQDRLCWQINLNSKETIDIGDTNPKRTGDLLVNIQVAATKAGKADIANQAAQQLEDLKKDGKLSPDRATGMLRDSRNLGSKT